jgi:hypothetical protein
MDENVYKKWSLVLQSLTALSIVVGGALGLWRYFDTTTKQFQKPLWDRQIELYFELSNVSSTLASTNDHEEWMSARVKFFKLINGPMIIVQDNKVQIAIETMANKLVTVSWKDIEASLQDSKTRPPLERESIILSYTIRDALDTSMNLNRPAVGDEWRNWNQ